MGNAMHFVNSFNITVEILDKLLPSQKHKFEVFFYDAKSFVFAMQGEVWHRGLLLALLKWSTGAVDNPRISNILSYYPP